MNKQQFLAMSLPFELKCLSSEIGHVYDIISCHFGDYALVRVKPNNGRDFPLPINRIKSILHPLSDLTKPITHKGETFVPIEKLGYSINYYLWFDDLLLSDALKLIEWHFDIAELIEKDEAIDINALDVNPYK